MISDGSRTNRRSSVLLRIYTHSQGDVMYLKAIEIYGFKSFGERKYIEFDKGITSIIGPNGSGKSNILDAVLWVLGEQSYKTIRAKESSDVIFSGGKEIKNVNYAEVSLTLDNLDRYFDYDSDDIKVTRKLSHKKGALENEYFINDRRVRLKDINNMFLDTGIGKSAYSVIGQGKVERIINSQPKEIKSIIEEAAGTKKLISNKQDTEKKLESFDRSLEDLDLILNEKQANRDKTEKQAKEAVKFVEIRDARNQLAKGIYLTEQTLRTGQLEAEKLKKIKAEDEKKLLEASIAALVARQEAIKAEKEEIDRRMEELDAQNKDLSDAISQKKSERDVNGEKINGCGSAIDQLKRRIEYTGDRVAEKKQQLADTEAGRLADEKEVAAAESENTKKDAELEALRKEKNELQSVYDAKNTKIQNYEMDQHRRDIEAQEQGSRITNEKNAVAARKKELVQWEKDITKARSEKIGKEAEISVKEKLLDEKKEQETLLSTESDEKSRKHSALGRKIEQDTMQYNTDSQRLSTLITAEEQNEGYSEAVKEVLGSEIKGIAGTFASLVDIPERYERAVTAGAGGNLQDIIVETGDAAKECIEMLKLRKAGRASFLPLDTIKTGGKKTFQSSLTGVIGIAADLVAVDKKYEKAAEFVLGNMLVVENMDTGLVIVKKGLFGGSVVTLSGELLSARGRITGGVSKKGGANVLLSRRREIGELTEKTEALKIVIEKDRREYAQLGRDIEEIENSGEALGKAIKDLEDNLNEIREDLVTAGAAVDALERNGNVIKAEIELSEKTIAEYERRIGETRDEWEKLQDLKATLQAELVEDDKALTKINAKIGEKEKENETVRIRYMNLKNRIELALKTEADIQNEILTFETEIENDRKDIERNEALIVEFKEAIEKLVGDIKDLEAQYDERTGGAGDLRAADKKLDEEREKINDKRLSEQEEFGKRENEIAFAEKNIEKYSQDLLTLEEELKPLEQVTPKEIPDGELTASREEFKRLDGRLRSLGDVNVLAIDEFEELQKTVAELKRQKDDMVNGKAKVQEMKSEIEGNIRELFYQAYDAINANFSVMCAETLNNSDGKLDVIDADNFDECGIDISVKYKNKKRLPLSLLSGGEKSMVAIAFVIAIFMYKPSPFAFLDEIESALDETNTMKLLKKLKEFTEKSQFILITHNKTTMTQSDGIIGVTMNKEIGVTEIPGVNLRERLNEFLRENKGTAVSAKEAQAAMKKK
ncbi:MAG: chromosome segregation protein SMC [Fusobacteriaceae bacterium]|jgi:chromosome segregation protein|nr:chromosome segregation protein SMC [Fusobacteriaceae bacterium]